jgi:hypothetical protein
MWQGRMRRYVSAAVEPIVSGIAKSLSGKEFLGMPNNYPKGFPQNVGIRRRAWPLGLP